EHVLKRECVHGEKRPHGLKLPNEVEPPKGFGSVRQEHEYHVEAAVERERRNQRGGSRPLRPEQDPDNEWSCASQSSEQGPSQTARDDQRLFDEHARPPRVAL